MCELGYNKHWYLGLGHDIIDFHMPTPAMMVEATHTPANTNLAFKTSTNHTSQPLKELLQTAIWP